MRLSFLPRLVPLWHAGVPLTHNPLPRLSHQRAKAGNGRQQNNVAMRGAPLWQCEGLRCCNSSSSDAGGSRRHDGPAFPHPAAQVLRKCRASLLCQ